VRGSQDRPSRGEPVLDLHGLRVRDAVNAAILVLLKPPLSRADGRL
jgi:hypothetical protein